MNNNNYPSITQYQQLVELKDYRPTTKYEYVRQVRQLAAHVKTDPATLNENQIRHYFLFLRQERHWQGSAMTQARVALRSFYRESLHVGQDWTIFEDLCIARPEPLPLVLTQEQIRQVLGVVRELRYQTCLRRSIRAKLLYRLSAPSKKTASDRMGTQANASASEKRAQGIFMLGGERSS